MEGEYRMKQECAIVDDLLPLYGENMLNEETEEYVELHLNKCKECRDRLEVVKTDVTLGKPIYQEDYNLSKRIFLKIRKKVLIFIVSVIFFFLILFLIAVGYIVYGKSGQESYYTKSIQDYGNYTGHIEEEEILMHSNLLIFPDKAIAEKYGESYLYNCEIVSFAGNSYFIALICNYDEETLNKEKNRLENIKLAYDGKNKEILVHSINEENKVYISILGQNGRREYALVEGNKITYVFSQYSDYEEKYLSMEEKEFFNMILESEGEYNLYINGDEYHDSLNASQ